MSKAVQEYIIRGLEATPRVVSHMASGASASVLDRKPDPERFSLREVLAHLDDWDGVWMRRVNMILENENPTIEGYNPDEMAKKGNYDKADPAKSLKSFEKKRADFIAKLKNLNESQWQRTGTHTVFGSLSVQDLVQIALGHDGYHLKQIAEWIEWKK